MSWPRPAAYGDSRAQRQRHRNQRRDRKREVTRNRRYCNACDARTRGGDAEAGAAQIRWEKFRRQQPVDLHRAGGAPCRLDSGRFILLFKKYMCLELCRVYLKIVFKFGWFHP